MDGMYEVCSMYEAYEAYEVDDVDDVDVFCPLNLKRIVLLLN